jgi:hypothetical protein
MPNHGFGRCDGHHKMVDCIGLAPGDFPIRTREWEIDRKKMTGQIGRSTFVSPVARSYSASVMLSDAHLTHFMDSDRANAATTAPLLKLRRVVWRGAE